VPSRRPSKSLGRGGLSTLRRSGAVSDLLFLYECETREVAQLRSIAEPLGLSVQAASHTFRSLARRGLVELRDGRYRPTVRGVEWLHAALGSVRDDLAERLDRLRIVRTMRAVAAAPIEAGDAVVLELRDGLLTARAGRGPGAHGRAHSSAPAGGLLEVGELEGIVPLPHGRLRVVPLPTDRLQDPTLLSELRATVRSAGGGLLLAGGLGASHLTSRAFPNRPLVRFGVAAAIEEATQLGVDCTLVAVDRDLPRVLEQLRNPEPPSVEFLSLRRGARRRRRAG
jgi:putative transcriptional regulator